MRSENKYKLIDEGREAFPQGLPLSHLQDELVPPGPGEDPEKPEYYRYPELLNFLQPFAEERYGRPLDWEKEAHTLPLEAFDNFTTDEKVRFLHRGIFMSDLSEMMEANVRYTHFNKLRLALWHWGPTDSYADFVRFYNGIRSFSFGLEGFEARLDYTSHANEYGYANFHRSVYLDAELAFMIYHKGKHVLTIGFSPSKRGILLAQVQCAKKKGNRWLYHLKMPLLQHVVTQLKLAFPQDTLWLVNGKALAEKTRKSYESTKEMTISDETLHYIEQTYKTTIPGYRRTKHYRRRNLLFKELRAMSPTHAS